jgi:hypothetical protein
MYEFKKSDPIRVAFLIYTNNYKSYIGKCRLERSLEPCSETELDHYLFHIGIVFCQD